MYKAILYPNGKGTVVRTDGPFRMAKIKARGCEDGTYSLDDKLVRSVLLPFRYIPEDVKSEDFGFFGLRRGRTTDVILEEPLIPKGFTDEYFFVASFKGTGAITYEHWDYIIHPTDWFMSDDLRYGRIWGSLDEGHALGEAKEDCLKKLKILHTPYVSINPLPLKVEEEIYRQAYGGFVRRPKDVLRLCQIVRLTQTNIRLWDNILWDVEGKRILKEACEKVGWSPKYLIDLLVKEDIKICLAEKKLNDNGKRILGEPMLVRENRFWTGELTDMEQIKISSLDGTDSKSFPLNVIEDTDSFIKERLTGLFEDDVTKLLNYYFKQLSSGISFEISPLNYGDAILTFLNER